MKLIKTIKFDLLPLTKRKLVEIERVLSEFQWVANEAAKRMPSLPKRRVERKTDRIWYDWTKEFRKQVDLPAQCAQEAVHKAREAYLASPRVPKFKADFARWHNQSFRFERHGNTWYVNLPTRGGRKNSRVLLPLKCGERQLEVLEQIKAGKLDHGTGELVKRGNHLTFNLTVERERKIMEGATPIGIDMGLVHLVCAVPLVKGKPKAARFWRGGEVKRRRERWERLRAELSRRGLLRRLRALKDKERRWMRSYNHKVSREVVDHAKKYENPVLVLEDLKHIRRSSGFKEAHRWNFRQLQDFIKYKAAEEGIPVIHVRAKNTSIACSRCGYIDKRSRRSRNFTCVKCGYSVNAEVNAAINIARAGLIKLNH